MHSFGRSTYPFGRSYRHPGVQKGSGTPNTAKVGSITMAQAREIGEAKMADLNANDADAAAKIIAGTARSMGITVED